jgi:glycerophosphoryl diester phosphodiesterase
MFNRILQRKLLFLPSLVNSMRNIINIAHRGYTRRFPDNTLESFRAALELGVDGVEFDVQETLDGSFFIFHDDAIGGKAIAQSITKEILAARVGGNYHIPTLQETLELIGHGPILVVELKQVCSLDRFLEILRSHADVNRVAIVSFSSELISKLAELAPDIKRAVITNTGVKNAEEITRSTHSMAIGITCTDLDSTVINRLHEEGTLIFVWDCNDAEDLKKALEFNIDGIISDMPDLVKQFLRNAP